MGSNTSAAPLQEAFVSEILVKSIKKGLDALDFVAAATLRGDGASLTEIAAGLGEKPSTLRNILRTMEGCGYLARAGRLYVPGPKCLDLLRCTSGRDLVARAGALLAEAAQRTGESFVLVTLVQGRRRVLSRHQGGSAVTVNLDAAEEGEEVYVRVTTRILLAFAEPAERQRILQAYGQPGAAWPAAAADLDACLARLREAGVALYEDGVLFACAVPLLDGESHVLGAAGAYAPLQRATANCRQGLVDTLQAVAAAVRG